MKYIIVCDEKPQECNSTCAFFGEYLEEQKELINHKVISVNLKDGCVLLNKSNCYDECPLTEVKTLFTTEEV